jgi:hypothetical protein
MRLPRTQVHLPLEKVGLRLPTLSAAKKVMGNEMLQEQATFK